MSRDNGELQKYFDMLVQGNAIAVRMDKKIISEHTAKTLFGKMIEDLAHAIQEEKQTQ